MRAFHGDPKVKTKYLKRVRAHRAADQIIHGTYWEDGKGCAVGCTIHSSDHAAYETESASRACSRDWKTEYSKRWGMAVQWNGPSNFLTRFRLVRTCLLSGHSSRSGC